MTKSLLADLIKLARVGANTLGQTAHPQTMVQVWTVIGQAETELAQPEPVLEQPLTNDKVN